MANQSPIHNSSGVQVKWLSFQGVLISFLYYSILLVFAFVFRYSHVYLEFFFLRLVQSVPLGGNCVTIYSNTVIIKVIRSMMLVPPSFPTLNKVRWWQSWLSHVGTGREGRWGRR